MNITQSLYGKNLLLTAALGVVSRALLEKVNFTDVDAESELSTGTPSLTQYSLLLVRPGERSSGTGTARGSEPDAQLYKLRCDRTFEA